MRRRRNRPRRLEPGRRVRQGHPAARLRPRAGSGVPKATSAASFYAVVVPCIAATASAILSGSPSGSEQRSLTQTNAALAGPAAIFA